MGPEPNPLAPAVHRPDTKKDHHEENIMSIAVDARRVRNQAMEVRVVKPLQFDDHTPQTTGMRRLAAISHLLAGSESLWAGVMLAEPKTTSSVHHHGPLETVVYVLSGTSKVRWGSRLEHEVDLEPGDFLLIPPYTPHQEINPSPDQPTMWVVVRSGQEAVIVHLMRAHNGEYVAIGTNESEP
jgi:uncharacterized RmlC-like cupin family protein